MLAWCLLLYLSFAAKTLVTPDLIVSALLFQWRLGIVVLKSLWIELRSMSPKNIYLGTRETAAQRRWPLPLSKSK